MSACIGEPVSWPRLEQVALGGADAAAAAHLAACPACARCLAELRADTVALPPLAVPAPRPRRRWWPGAAAFAGAAAVAVAVLVVVRIASRPRAPHRTDVAQIKGVGEVVLGVVRERDGAIRHDALTYAPGDRWKVVVTCPPAAAAWIDVAVLDATGAAYPLPAARIACGNRVAVPGAFAITGGGANRVCVRIAAGAAPDRTTAAPPDACVTLAPE